MRRLFSIGLVLIVLSMTLPSSAQESIEDARARQAEIEREAARAAGQLDVLEAEDEALFEALKRLDRWIAAEEGRLEAARQELAAAQEAQATARDRATALTAEIERLADAVARQSVDSYIAGFDGEDSLLLGADDINAVPVLKFLVDEASGQSADTSALLRTARQLQEEAFAEAEAAEQVAADLTEEIAGRVEELEQDRRAQAELRAEVDARIGRLEETAQRLADEDAQIEEFIIAEQARIAEEARQAELARLEAERLEQERLEQEQNPDPTPVGDPTPTPPPNDGTAPSFIRPVGGAVSSPFGNRVHPVFGTVRFHSGLDFDSPNGTPIGAAADGVVIFAGGFDGYGNAVIIDHGGGYSSLYAHMSGFETSVGASVSAGTTVGYVGTTGVSTGPHLHFEIRINGGAVDPAAYV